MQSELFSKYKNIKVEKENYHDFQIFGKEISDYVGEPAYYLFAKYHHGKIRDAFFKLKKSGKTSLKYMIGIIKKL